MFYLLIFILAVITFFLSKLEAADIIEVNAEYAHAAIANNEHVKDNPQSATTSFKIAKLISDGRGHFIDVTTKYIGQAKGGSCRNYGIKNGQNYLADVITDYSTLKNKDVVIINARADRAFPIKKRLRIFKEYNGSGYAVFYPSTTADGLDYTHKPRPTAELYAVITHLI
jgi:hypothetical protein